MKSKVTVDTTIGPQPHISIKMELTKDSKGLKYILEVTKPNGDLLMPPVELENPMDTTSIVFVLSKAMANVHTLNYGYNNVPYLWDGHRWVDADDWLKTLSFSMHGLLRTGEYSGKSSRCFYNTMRSAWLAANRKVLALKPFGVCDGVPLKDGVFNVMTNKWFAENIVRLEERSIVMESIAKSYVSKGDNDWESTKLAVPDDGNMHVLNAQCSKVSECLAQLKAGGCEDSVLMTFLRSSLNPDQVITLQRWFGLHLIVHRVGNPEKMLYMYGLGGNGKGMVIRLLRALVTDDAVATLQLSDLKVSSNLELLIGKLAMIGAEAKASTTENKTLKTIVSWEEITINPKYRDPFTFQAQCLVTQASNDPPFFNDESEAMVRRVIALNMTFVPMADEKIQDIAGKVLKDEYALLIAWALAGAKDILDKGELDIPQSVLEHSAKVVRSVLPVDRFIDSLETGNFEVAEDELYAAYGILCRRQGLELTPKREFLADLDTRLKRIGMTFLHRPKATGYLPQTHVHENGKLLLLAPQLKDATGVNIYLGFRIQAGEYGPAIGPKILAERREVPNFEAG